MSVSRQRARAGDGVTFRGKRLFDLAIAVPLAVVTLPVVGVAAVAVLLESGSPVLFKQTRVGQHERPFTVYKIRTMTVEDRSREQTHHTSPGVTRVGRVMRVTKIDELPQLWNVVAGNMSVVGPRPCLPETASEMTLDGRRRFAVKPGLTGLAQVNGNVLLSWPDRIRYDVEYVDRGSLRTDVAVLLRTLAVVARGRA